MIQTNCCLVRKGLIAGFGLLSTSYIEGRQIYQYEDVVMTSSVGLISILANVLFLTFVYEQTKRVMRRPNLIKNNIQESLLLTFVTFNLIGSRIALARYNFYIDGSNPLFSNYLFFCFGVIVFSAMNALRIQHRRELLPL